MSDKLPSREHVLSFLQASGCSEDVVEHSRRVAELATKISEKMREKGVAVDLSLVETGALMHDIGRSRTHQVDHAISGARIARHLGLPEGVISIIERHVGGGISDEEARRLRWPSGTYIPQTIEEKIVCYADKRIDGSRLVPMKRTIEKLKRDNRVPPSSVERLLRIHQEIVTLVGDCNCLL